MRNIKENTSLALAENVKLELFTKIIILFANKNVMKIKLLLNKY